MQTSINTSVWITQQALADQLGVKVQNVHNWVQRSKIDWQYLPGSRIKLVNQNTIRINSNHHKCNNVVKKD